MSLPFFFNIRDKCFYPFTDHSVIIIIWFNKHDVLVCDENGSTGDASYLHLTWSTLSSWSSLHTARLPRPPDEAHCQRVPWELPRREQEGDSHWEGERQGKRSPSSHTEEICLVSSCRSTESSYEFRMSYLLSEENLKKKITKIYLLIYFMSQEY